MAFDRLKARPRAFARYVVPASAGGAPTLPDALDCLTLKAALQPKETKEAKEFEGFTRTRPPTCRVNGRCLRTSFLSAFCVSFGHPTAMSIVQPKNRSSAERNERSGRIRGLYANAATHLPGEWRLPQHFFSFGIFRFFRPYNCHVDRSA